MKTFLTLAVALGGLAAAPVASNAAGLVPGSGADFTPAPKVETVTRARSDDNMTTSSTRTYGATRRLPVSAQQQKAEQDSTVHQRPSVLVPGSGADFSQ